MFSEAVYDYPALQQDVCEYVRDLKTSGMSAQNVIVTTRNLVMETAGGAPLPDRIEKLLTKMLGWCLEEYYKESA